MIIFNESGVLVKKFANLFVIEWGGTIVNRFFNKEVAIRVAKSLL